MSIADHKEKNKEIKNNIYPAKVLVLEITRIPINSAAMAAGICE
jgi:hypothetical protein